jgi:hypothetical protein
MPPGYKNRVEEIERLTRDLEGMTRFGRLLWTTGDDLAQSVRDLLSALRLQIQDVDGGGPCLMAASLDAASRLLVHVSPSGELVEKRSPELAAVFQLLHEIAGDADRVVLVANHAPDVPPAERPVGISTDGLALMTRLGANFVSAHTLFQLWTLSLQDGDRARGYLQRLRDQDGGLFELPASAVR